MHRRHLRGFLDADMLMTRFREPAESPQLLHAEMASFDALDPALHELEHSIGSLIDEPDELGRVS
jgi:hypothetical protein